MEEIKSPSPEQSVLSIVAGATLSSLCQGLNHSSVIRAMPNMPAQIGEGMTIWTATAETKQRQKELAHTVLGALGKEIYVTDEKYLGMATALSGSGPAYVFLFIEALVDAGVHIGLPRDMAQELVIQTILGSTLTVEKTGKHPAELRNMVTSPGGTTTDGLFQLEKGRFRSLILEAVAAAYEKAKRL
jgi:pyrroline-5-carboxylate reductase